MKNDTIKPLITEKSVTDAANGWYTFVTRAPLQKQTVASLISFLYGVKVVMVRSSVYEGKVRRVGKRGKTVQKSDWKKMMVRLSKGQTIEAFQVGGSEAPKV